MSKKSMLVELYNKYPQHRVEDYGESIAVRDGSSGKLVLFLKKTCHGAFECDKAESGAKECLDRSPVAEECKVFELKKDGSIGKVEGWEDRRMISKDYLARFGKIPSEVEVQALAKKEAAKLAKKKASDRVSELKSQAS